MSPESDGVKKKPCCIKKTSSRFHGIPYYNRNCNWMIVILSVFTFSSNIVIVIVIAITHGHCNRNHNRNQ